MSITASCDELTVVIVDDDSEHRVLIRTAIEEHCDTGRTIHIVEHDEPDVALVSLPPDGNVVLLVDYNLDGASGLDWIQDFAKAAAGPVIIVTSSGDEEIAAKAFRMGATDYLDKGDIIREPVELWTSISRAMRRFKLEQTNRELSRTLKVTNAELLAKNERLAILTRNAQQFVEDVAHEFRTPLTVIREFASIMADGIGGEISSKQCDYLEFITDATSDLANLVDDFLDSGKLRTGMLRVNRESHEPRDIIQSTQRMIESRAATKNIQINIECPETLPRVNADIEKASRALLNLVTNAIKFTEPRGSITIRAVLCAHAVRFEVEDNGPGLTNQEIDHLFERFRQCESAHQISDKGFGLGLSIVRDLVSINLGSVEIWSSLGEGSVFSFSVPIDEPESILRAFLHNAHEHDSHTPVAAILVRGNPQPENLASTVDFLASVCYGTDLVLRQADCHSVVLVGQTANYKKWLAKLQAAHETRCHGAHSTRTYPLSMKVIGLWNTDEDANKLNQAIAHEVAGESHESFSTDR